MRYLAFYLFLLVTSFVTSYACLLAGWILKSLFNSQIHFSVSLVTMADVSRGAAALFLVTGLISAAGLILSSKRRQGR